MKSIILSSVVTALLVFSGCADKEPVVDEPSAVKQEVVLEVVEVETETVSDANTQVDSNTNSFSMSDIENKLSAVYFAFDKFDVSSDMQANISTGAMIVNNTGTDYNVKLEGNCDEWGSDEYNFALGLKRANAVKKSLVAEGVDTARISMVSYGESNPVCSDKTQDCWSKNRRVDFKLLP